MKKNWMSYNAREAFRRGLNTYTSWNSAKILEKFEKNKENIPTDIYAFLQNVETAFLKEIFLSPPRYTSPNGKVYYEDKYHHLSDENGYVYIDYFYMFLVPDFSDSKYSLKELQVKYQEFKDYIAFLGKTKYFYQWDKKSIISALEQYGADKKILKLLNGCSIKFLQKEVIEEAKYWCYNFLYRASSQRSTNA